MSSFRNVLLFLFSVASVIPILDAAPLNDQDQHIGSLNASHLDVLHPRLTEGHQDPEKKITLYHGTPPKFLPDMMEGIEWKAKKGDLSRHGGFYLTDSLRAAAQWACYNKHDRETQAGILEFVWDGRNAKVLPYSSWDTKEEYENFVSVQIASMLRHSDGIKLTDVKPLKEELLNRPRKYEMIEGPMESPHKGIPKDFWQYAVVKKEALEDKLKITEGYTVSCKNIQFETETVKINLQDTQGPVKNFSSDVKTELDLQKFAPEEKKAANSKKIEES